MKGGWAVLVLLFSAAVLSAFGLGHLEFDHDTRSLLRNDPEADRTEDRLQEVFGAEDLLLLAWEADDITAPREFARVLAVTRDLEGIDGLEEAYSIANRPIIAGGLPRVLTEADFATPEARKKTRAALLAAGPYAGTFYSPDLKVVAVASALKPGTRAFRARVLDKVRAAAARHRPAGGIIHVSGVTPFAIEASEYAIADLLRIGLLALGVAVAVLVVLCRSLRETLVAVVATCLPPLFALGLASALSLPLTAMGAALFPVMVVVGITGSVHLLNAAAELRDPVLAARRLAPPVLLSLFTTALAFFSLRATGVPAFRGAGVVVGFGLLTAIPVVLLGIPAALTLLPTLRGAVRSRALDRTLLRTAMLSVRRPKSVLALAAAVAIACGAVIPGSRLQVQVLQAFEADSGIARTYRFLEQRLTATVPVDLVLEARPDQTDEQVLADLRKFSAAAEGLEGVADTLGLAELVDYGRTIMPTDAMALHILRGTMAEVARRFEDKSRRLYRIKVRVREGTGPAVLDRLEEFAAATTSGSATLTGLFRRAVHTTRHLVRDLFRGCLLMTLLVVLTVAVALRSWRLGVAALLPNLMPPLVVFGAAAALGAALDVSAVAVGAVAIGLAVDDTLHVLFRVVRERRRRPLRSALLRTQRSVGRALVLSSVVLVAGLCCLIFSSFLPTARFGVYCASACAVALLADLILLPALLQALRA